jgi:uncharacterized membrane protein
VAEIHIFSNSLLILKKFYIINLHMKQFKNRKSSKDFSTNKNELEVNATKTNNKMLNEIDKLKKQI